jgi:hypothetical protein
MYMPNLDTPSSNEPEKIWHGPELGLIVGGANNGKTPVMTYVATEIAKRMAKSSAWKSGDKSRRVLYFTLESTVEDIRLKTERQPSLTISRLPMIDMNTLELAMLAMPETPLVISGASLSDIDGMASMTKLDKFERTTVTKIADTILELNRKHGISPHCIFIDHFHLLTTDRPAKNLGERYEVVADEIVELVNWSRVPVFVAAQAAIKEINSRAAENQQPRIDEIRYGSTLIDFARNIYTVWMPDRTFNDNTKSVRIRQRDGRSVDCPAHQSFVLVKCVKSRNARAGNTEVLSLGGYLPGSVRGEFECVQFDHVELNEPSDKTISRREQQTRALMREWEEAANAGTYVHDSDSYRDDDDESAFIDDAPTTNN